MGQDLRIEHPDHASFITTKTLHSRLWFHRNEKLQNLILAHLAKYQEKYGVIVYYFVLLGNHYHLGARFPNCNRAAFMRDFNRAISRVTNSHAHNYPGGPLWARRYRPLVIVEETGYEASFLYAALNPVSTGLVEKLSDYKEFGYSSCYESIKEAKKKFTMVDWRTYRDRVRYNKKLTPKDFEHTYTLTYSRLPGYEELSAKEYETLFCQKVELRRKEIIERRRSEKKSFAGVALLQRTTAGSQPRSTKKSKRHDPRQLIWTSCQTTKRWYLDLYFDTRAAFTLAYQRLKEGARDILFPSGTYHPPLCWVAT